MGIAGIYHIISCFQPLQELSHLVCRCLSIIVKTYQNISRHLMKACHQGSMLSKVFCQIHPADIQIFPAKLLNH